MKFESSNICHLCILYVSLTENRLLYLCLRQCILLQHPHPAKKALLKFRSAFDLKPFPLGQAESPHQENSHLCAADGHSRTIAPATTSTRDGFRRQLLNPSVGPIPQRHIPKHGPRGVGGSVRAAVLCAQQEDRHLVTSHNQVRTVISIPATSGDTLRRQLFDPIRSPRIGRHVPKNRSTCKIGRAHV